MYIFVFKKVLGILVHANYVPHSNIIIKKRAQEKDAEGGGG